MKWRKPETKPVHLSCPTAHSVRCSPYIIPVLDNNLTACVCTVPPMKAVFSVTCTFYNLIENKVFTAFLCTRTNILQMMCPRFQFVSNASGC